MTGAGRVLPVAGQVWRSRDPRDEGLTARVVDVANGMVRIDRARGRRSTVRLERFHREYELVGGSG